MKEKKLYMIAIVGATICFIGDNLLGFFTPAADFGNQLLCVNFSYDWSEVNPYRFAIAGMCGIVSLLMMLCGFYGIFLRMKRMHSALAKPFLLSSIVFVAVGTMYHNVFAITAFIYNRLSNAGYGHAKSLTLEVFNVFIFVGALAAVGYGIMALLMFIDSVKGRIYPFKWMWCINPFVFMIISIGLSKMLPQNAFTNGVFSLGQQGIGLFIVFVVLYFTTEG